MNRGIIAKKGEAASLSNISNKMVYGWNWGGVLNVVVKFTSH